MPSDQLMPPQAVRTRRDLAEYLGQALLDEYYFRHEKKIVRQVSTHLKTYLLEVHPRATTDSPEAFAIDGVSLESTGEPTLFMLTPQGSPDGERNAYFLDMLNPRYPLVHTINYTGDSDPFIQRLVTRSSGVDSCWFPSAWLKAASAGRLIGFRLFFQHGLSGTAESSEAETLREELGRSEPPAFRLRVSDFIDAHDDLEALRRTTQFGSNSAIDSLAWRKRDEQWFIHEEVWHNGKFSAHGTSWDSHLQTVIGVQDRYSATISELERRFVLSVRSGYLSGSPVDIRFGTDSLVTDISALAQSLVDPGGPLRLLGSAEQRDDDHWSIEAVDLHTNDRLAFDLHPNLLRMYLRSGACGNAVTRILVHVERHIDARATTSVDELLAPTSDTE